MRIHISKIILFFAFSVFLTHDVLPHIHFDDHSQQTAGHQIPAAESDHLILEHQIDDNFTVNKVIKVHDLTASFIQFYISYPHQDYLSNEQYTFDKYRSAYISYLSISVLKDRAPPVL